MVSHRDKVTHVGDKYTDEMCRYYLMYWTPRSSMHGSLRTKDCDNGDPSIHWSNYFATVP